MQYHKHIKWYLKKVLFHLNLDISYFPTVMVQEDYHSQNPYHNAVHAADVTQAMHCYLKEPKVRECCHFHIHVYVQKHTYLCVHINELCANIHTCLCTRTHKQAFY